MIHIFVIYKFLDIHILFKHISIIQFIYATEKLIVLIRSLDTGICYAWWRTSWFSSGNIYDKCNFIIRHFINATEPSVLWLLNNWSLLNLILLLLFASLCFLFLSFDFVSSNEYLQKLYLYCSYLNAGNCKVIIERSRTARLWNWWNSREINSAQQ